MMNNIIGKISKITGQKVLIDVTDESKMDRVGILNQKLCYLSIGALVGTKLVDNRTLILIIEEILDSQKVIISCSISGIYDEVIKEFKFGTNTYPIIRENVFQLDTEALNIIFNNKECLNTIGTYVYNKNVNVSYNSNILFGKHLGVFGNTGSGKTCTIVSLIQNYLKNNPRKDIKFIVFDVNNEYSNAFPEEETMLVPFEELRANHNTLQITEYGKLFRAAEGVQFPALREIIKTLSNNKTKPFDLNSISASVDKWIDKNTPDRNGTKDTFIKGNLSSNLRTMIYRIEGICNDTQLMNVINSSDADTLNQFEKSNKRVLLINLQVSSDTLDIILFILFKNIYLNKAIKRCFNSHLCLILEEAHRYINNNIEDSKLGAYYIDKLAREGRKFGLGLIISSQVPSMLSYEIVGQCNSVIMHKITSKKDLEFLKGVMRLSNDSFYCQMSSLEKQYAIVCGEAFKNDSLVKILNAYPLPDSNDPTISDIYK